MGSKLRGCKCITSLGLRHVSETQATHRIAIRRRSAWRGRVQRAFAESGERLVARKACFGVWIRPLICLSRGAFALERLAVQYRGGC